MQRKMGSKIELKLKKLEDEINLEIEKLFNGGAFKGLHEKIAKFLYQHEALHFSLSFCSRLWAPTPQGYKLIRVRNLGDMPVQILHEFAKHPKYKELYQMANTLKKQGAFLRKIQKDKNISRKVYPAIRFADGNKADNTPCPRCGGSGISKKVVK
jgi:hypothetical protein